jgi:dihydroorotase-like cyclic amidohydrolase
MAYKGIIMVNDELLLQGLKKCKSLGALAMVHAENGDAVEAGQQKMIELGITGPEGHPLSRPPAASYRYFVFFNKIYNKTLDNMMDCKFTYLTWVSM